MPIVLLDRVPLPSLRTYTSLSIVFVACAFYYSHYQVLEFIGTDIEQSRQYEQLENTTEPLQTKKENTRNFRNKTLTTEEYLMDFAAIILQEPWCIWVLINMAYCCLILYGKLIQKVVFGDLRVSEQQNLKDKFWNFMFYTFIFIFGVMNVQTMEEVVLWCAWFTVLGFLHLISQLAKDRFEYLCSSPATPTFTHVKLMLLLIGVEICCFLLLFVCFGIGFFFSGINTFAFMTAECVLLLLKTMYVIIRYIIQLWDENREGVWENRSIYVYYTELVFELIVLSIDFCHHLHMLLWGNIFLSMASLVICMQLRYLFYELKRRVRRHNNYKRVVKHMHDKFPMATKEELEALDDPCAVCWERMENARKLSCGHFFHNSCLRSWLEQDVTCPTCRTSLGDSPLAEDRLRPAQPGPAGDAPREAETPPAPQRQLRNHFFHFDGSRYVSWLPSFSVEVRHSQMPGAGIMRHLHHSQLDNMVRQVQEVFPDAPREAIIEDLQLTRSVQLTLENIIEGAVPMYSTGGNQADEEADQPPTSSTSHFGAAATSEDTPTPSEPKPRSNGESAVEGTDVDATSLNWSRGLEEWEDRMNIFADTEEEFADLPQYSGSRFSKSATDREKMLRDRKQQFLEQAKKNFLQKNKALTDDASESSDSAPSSSCSPSTSSDVTSMTSNGVDGAVGGGERTEVRQRRELHYEATVRRLQQANPQ